MDPVWEMVIPFMTLMGLGGMVLIGMRLRYEHLRHIKRGGGASEDEVKQLAEAVDGLRDEVRLMRRFAEWPAKNQSWCMCPTISARWGIRPRIFSMKRSILKILSIRMILNASVKKSGSMLKKTWKNIPSFTG